MRQITCLFTALLCAMAILTGCSPGGEPERLPPAFEITKVRGGIGSTASASVKVGALDPGDAETVRIGWTADFRAENLQSVAIRRGPGVGATAEVSAERGGDSSWTFSVESAASDFESGGTIAYIDVEAPSRIVTLKQILLEDFSATADGAALVVSPVAETLAFSLVTDPVLLFSLLATVVAGVYWCSQRKALAKFFDLFPPLIWMYFVPMVLTTAGLIPDSSPVYSPFMSRVMLPAILVLLLIPADIRSIVQLGPKAILVMLIATLGITVGAITSFGIFNATMPDALPPETWKGVAAIAGSWIGGSPNMTAVIESVGTPPSLIGPLVIVDTVLAYSWLGLLIAMSSWQRKIDTWNKADARVIDDISARLKAEQDSKARAPITADIAFMVAVAFLVSQVCLAIGKPVDHLVANVWKIDFLSEVFSAYGWGILLITAAGLLLSMTKVRELEFCGASSIGYTGLYLLLTTYGAQANLVAILEVPVFFALGFVWLAIHIGILFLGVKLTRAPLFLGATSSMANIGGTASAPVVAAAYNPSMAPVGLLMAILGGVLGTPIALMVIATACKALAGE